MNKEKRTVELKEKTLIFNENPTDKENPSCCL